MNAYRAVGALKTGKFSWQKFSLELAADDEAQVTEQVYSNLGSRHKLKRQQIRIDEITLLDKDSITDITVQYLVGGAQ
ncbi:50S ribosomal protein L18Ae [Candidatus Methanomassiliicoccus intestinalis]|jgi:ribosomal L18ae/LX protein domain|uniref:Large ribosomal subunit protein eL20 n=2 Tax=Candidatus Methanomassiliicoccus intestinalis TaxID=1406512 RepID=R9TCM3_METII|nr:50S ribosomal protein L18Ae [Candidatus Methanomassiliicoccus intestinalis]AGN27208.1 Ribosomal LX protein [Candidatus Methanomassiliicoccus intestinalis Issoire-Mx1]TQS81712.1 MAG: 50S ribosomal protein LX [Candidatus Methanomassiliicoccus intestinalis]TQS84345.1 MAG: 50S ribosomal protein LX [Candidatus Methanomassiliicoccus intestinalis]